MLANLKAAVAGSARRSAIGLLGGLALAVGLGFLTLALWIVLVSLSDRLTAALVIGSTYGGIGLLLLAYSMSGRSRKPIERPRSRPARGKGDLIHDIAAAFFEGVGAGLAAKPPRDGAEKPQKDED